MKALEQMDNVARGYLLAGLFPEELPGIVTDIRQRVAYLQEHKDDIRKTWDNGLITLGFWCDLAKRVLQVIEKYESRLLENRRLFSDQLFDGYNALFTVDCIVKYADEGNGSIRFRLAVKMLLEYHP
ncbi:hypothetical protein LS482_17355 [Sinomicrobium kalidii]|uniref:hypothetical protein n=1 Tax=Sinomicrobium kalidii TaxID=2900738 RepID=UPI001E44023F|nr:hypothetical protein [Sinomicrobium kalidii]UGU15437.1 hypothetical protein LS482_17355 [Sinomicrobium kalidii]